MSKTHWKKLTNPDYIGAYVLLELGTDLTVTISKVTTEMVANSDGKKEQCTVAHLVGQKPLILNSTNCKMCAKLFGSPFIEDWAGKSMTLYVAQVRAFGDTVDALRIRPTLPKAANKPELTPAHQRWAGAKKAIADGTTTIEQIESRFFLSPENRDLLCSK